jgi:predicted dehydrogenase
MQTYRIAIIGVGAIAEIIAKALGEIPAAKLVAAGCRTQSKGEQFVQKFGGAWFADYEKLLGEAKPDLAIICTPSGAHLEPALACAKRGIHVLCEKPIEVTVARVREMIDAFEKSGARLGGIFPQRFNPVNALVRDAASGGRFGDLSVIVAWVPWWRDDAYYGAGRWQGTMALEGGGALMNQATHTVDLVQWFAAATMPELRADENPVEEVAAFTAKRGHDPKLIEVEDTAVVNLRFRNGALGQLLAATSMHPGRPRRLTVSGRDGMAEVFEDELVHWSFRTMKSDDEEIRNRFARPTSHGGGASNPMAIDYVPHRRNIEDFLESLEGKRAPLLTGRESLKAVQIIEACYEAARTGRVVKIS